MSVHGEPQVINTVKSSWEILDSPVPINTKYTTEAKLNSLPPISHASTSLRSEWSVYPVEVKLPLSNTFTSLRTECTQDSVEPLEEITTEGRFSLSRHNTSTGHPGKAEKLLLKSDFNNVERVKTNSPISVYNIQNNSDILEEAVREVTSRGTATYVSTQRRPTEDIAETIATEFGQHVRKSQRFAKKEAHFEETIHFPHLHNQVITEETLNTVLYKADHEESTLPKASYSSIEIQTDGVHREINANIRTDRSPNSREYSEVSRVSSLVQLSPASHQGHIPHSISSASKYSEVSNMSQPHTDGQRHDYNYSDANDQGRYRHQPPERERQVEAHDRNGQKSRRNPTNEGQQHRLLSNDSNLSHNQSDNTRSTVRKAVNDSIIAETEEQQGSTSRGNSIVSETESSVADVVDHPHVHIPTGPDGSFARQAMPLPSVPPPNFHPPPTIIQNGISQTDLLELMSKGLGQFTREMTVMVIEKLKPEYETFAKQVGAEVKDCTVTELKELREKLTTAETEVEALKLQRENLKVENVRDRDQMKKEFEKDRLKRVKEFEEKKELIINLEKENNQFKGLLKEKDRILKKAEMKAKSEEQKRTKSEEESEKKLKEMQKELDKAKGELLVQKSKKRLQVSSAQSKKECLGKLNSQHGLYHKHFNGHKPIQYDEGDD